MLPVPAQRACSLGINLIHCLNFCKASSMWHCDNAHYQKRYINKVVLNWTEVRWKTFMRFHCYFPSFRLYRGELWRINSQPSVSWADRNPVEGTMASSVRLFVLTVAWNKTESKKISSTDKFVCVQLLKVIISSWLLMNLLWAFHLFKVGWIQVIWDTIRKLCLLPCLKYILLISPEMVMRQI